MRQETSVKDSDNKRTQNLLIRRQEKTGRAGIKPCLPAAYNN